MRVALCVEKDFNLIIFFSMEVLNSSCIILYWSNTPTSEESLPFERNMNDFDDSNKPRRRIENCPLLSSQPVVKHYPDSYMYTYGNSITAEYDQCVIPSNNCGNIWYIGQIWYMIVMNYHLWMLLVCVDAFLLSCLIL